jgi:uncharacterized protein DUF551
VTDWVKCSERMPEPGDTVLIHFLDGTYFTARWLDGEWIDPDGLDFDYGRSDHEVTHWAPITAPNTGEVP